jgi:hypothetical protein
MSWFPRRSAAVPLITIVSALWAWPATPLAQSTPSSQSQLLMINEIHLKPETAPEWTELQKSELLPAQKKGGLPWRDTWTAGPGGNPALRVTVTPIASFARFDTPAPIVKALGQEGAAAFGAKNRRLISGSASHIVRARPELGFGTRPAEHKLAILTTATVANGRTAEFEAFLRADVVPALKKGGVTYYTVVQTIYGGDTNQYRTLIPIATFAELDSGHPLEKALGAAGVGKLLQKSAPFVIKLERSVIRYLPDLSYRPTGTTSP